MDSVFTGIAPFEIHFQGFTMSKEAVLVQGFSNDLQEVRRKVREAFNKEGLIIRERYFPETAHVTLMRFCKPLKNPQLFIETVSKLRNLPLGNCLVNNINLNICNWYNQKEKRKELAVFNLI